jgi:hypothetical protein
VPPAIIIIIIIIKYIVVHVDALQRPRNDDRGIRSEEESRAYFRIRLNGLQKTTKLFSCVS